MKLKKSLAIFLIVLFYIFLFFEASYATDPVHFKGFKIQPTSCTYAGTVTIDGLEAVDGEDEVGVFVSNGKGSNMLVGSCVIGQLMAGHYFVYIYGDDATTDEKDGAADNDELIFKVWDKSKNKEYTIPYNSMNYTANDYFMQASIPPTWSQSPPNFGLLNLKVIRLDVNEDGKLDLIDVIYLLEYMGGINRMER
ncbi:Dockerin domain-containing protein [Candidatus Magnetomoraceae bacterium gMMP-1]